MTITALDWPSIMATTNEYSIVFGRPEDNCSGSDAVPCTIHCHATGERIDGHYILNDYRSPVPVLDEDCDGPAAMERRG